MTGLSKTRVTLIAGGVGGAKMAEGFAHLENVDLRVICNIGDDDSFHGLWVSPDVDTMLYTLSDRINRAQGWGVEDDALRALSVLKDLGQETWMTLGDRDLGLHIFRTMQLVQGRARQDITDHIAKALGISARLLLSTEDQVPTRVCTESGWQSFQEYFVRDQCRPAVRDLAYEGQETARANPAALDALTDTDLIVIAPSNPLMSIMPILGIPGIGETLVQAAALRLAVSPFVGGRALKGPADKMLQSLGHTPSTAYIADLYDGLIDGLVIDGTDAGDQVATGLPLHAEQTVMKTRADKCALAQRLLHLANLSPSAPAPDEVCA
ncbi:2-phospho-L-lactate transferase [Shimia sp. R9_3]|uniref:2-phospho-L-lactate transferase n=1 Tax=Shimia sp. R9_3 TaxID=2821113 RepID=UPI001ADA9562|nr:2-phospho-L-lactate transferase [Shimia sp. R9_3]MBO9400025.1 2-phospho-L-lactate transferase [Shimia sp. R9_3]